MDATGGCHNFSSGFGGLVPNNLILILCLWELGYLLLYYLFFSKIIRFFD